MADFESDEIDKILEDDKKRGRRPCPPDAILLSARSRILSLTEQTWPEIGLVLLQIQRRGRISVKDAVSMFQARFQVWEREEDCELAHNLLRPKPKQISAKKLRSMTRDRESSKYAKSLSDAQDLYTECLNAFKEIDAFLFSIGSDQKKDNSVPMLTDETQEMIEKDRERRKEALEFAAQQSAEIRAKRSKINADWVSGCAYRSWVELIDFCADKRYRLTPLNFANAMAGVPSIAWRRSNLRCSPIKLDDGGRGNYVRWNVIRSIVSSRPARAKLISHFENAVRTQRGMQSPTLDEFALNWHYLKASIEAASQRPTTKRELPFKIAGEYSRRILSPTAVDRFLEKSSRITRAKIKKENKISGSSPVSADDKP